MENSNSSQWPPSVSHKQKCARVKTVGKGTDLREGILTLVTLNVMNSKDSADDELKKLLSAPIHDEVIVGQVLVTLRGHRALDESREQLRTIAKQERAALGPLPLNDATGALFSLCDAVIDRIV